MEYAVFIILSALVGALAFIFGRQSGLKAVQKKETLIRELELSLNELNLRRSLESDAAKKREEELKQLRNDFENTFKALSSEALDKSTRQFLELAKLNFSKLQEGAKGDLEKRQAVIKGLVDPMKDTLEKVDEKIRELDKNRTKGEAELKAQISGLLDSQIRLNNETQNLARALRNPNVRGRWGELQLERTVEFAGMLECVDFHTQVHGSGDDGGFRPDMTVKLPGDKTIIIDAKVPLTAYLEAIEIDDVERRGLALNEHAKQVRNHAKKLGSKQYWSNFNSAPEFVVMFLPGEAIYSSALESDPELIEFSAKERVILAAPTTLIALLKVAAYGWKQESVAEEAGKISQLGRELYERLATHTSYVEDIGKHLGKAVDSYNKGIRSMESRVLVTARKFQHLNSDGKKALSDLKPIDGQVIGASVPIDETTDS